MIFNVVFFVVLTSVLVQGSAIPFFARRLGVDAPQVSLPEPPDAVTRTAEWEPLVKLKVLSGSAGDGKQIADLNLPDDTWIAVLRREGHPIRPGGSTVLKGGDRLSVQSSGPSLDLLRSLVEKKEIASDDNQPEQYVVQPDE
jgi:cell volume regulation protein A